MPGPIRSPKVQHAGRIGPGRVCLDPTSCIRVGSALPKKVRFIFFKTGPDPIWMIWSGFGHTDLVQKQAGVQESSGPVLAELNKASYQLPRFHTRSRASTDGPDHTVQNQPVSDWVLAVCVGFWPDGSGPEVSRCARIIGPASGQSFRGDTFQVTTDRFSEFMHEFLFFGKAVSHMLTAEV